jgi:hypothetical protein
MKVRILSGNRAGQVVEQAQTEAEINIASGLVAPVDEPANAPAPAPPAKGKGKGKTV